MVEKLPFIWDYDIDEMQFSEILAGNRSFGHLDQDWAARRLIEYGSYSDIIHWIGFCRLIENWPCWRKRIRSLSRKRGLDFLVHWLPKKHPELCRE